MICTTEDVISIKKNKTLELEFVLSDYFSALLVKF